MTIHRPLNKAVKQIIYKMKTGRRDCCSQTHFEVDLKYLGGFDAER